MYCVWRAILWKIVCIHIRWAAQQTGCLKKEIDFYDVITLSSFVVWDIYVRLESFSILKRGFCVWGYKRVSTYNKGHIFVVHLKHYFELFERKRMSWMTPLFYTYRKYLCVIRIGAMGALRIIRMTAKHLRINKDKVVWWWDKFFGPHRHIYHFMWWCWHQLRDIIKLY